MSTLESFDNQPTGLPERPADDTPIMPRSQVNVLTDDGVRVEEQVATPMGEEAAAAETPDDPETAALQALLDEHESSSDTSETDTADGAPSDETTEGIDFDSPKVQALAKDFKEALGIDLKQAIDTYTQMTQMVQQQTQQQAEQEFKQAATTLKTEWGVNDAELNRRVSAVLDYANKLPENLRQQFDSVKGVQLLWAQIERKSGGAPPQASSSGDAQRSTNPTGVKTFRKSELMKLMMEKPSTYTKMQAEIARAYEAGTVIDDL
ncbi:head scaffolding protein [Phormidium phage Pf-WMP4]|uniref:PfWMP4_38 n=1 Tax=Phormidium phage Pf-WMP4 TaxID=2913979 RepID=Q0GBS8_9CAUD|nr:head scaffolding protein [Phormidium phage Pf-WMP4]ABI33182.1 PfWMP4_38 [Phormidium phage Pf-WMP4]